MNKYRKFIKRIISESELPKNTKFKGYVIHLPDIDEFLNAINNKQPEYKISYFWTKTPELAIVFKDHNKAAEIIKEYNKNKATLCLLLDLGKQLVIISEETVIENLGLN